MRVADYIMSFIEKELGVNTIFMVSGGGIMHLMDAVVCNENLKYVCSQNEQATTMQADGYAKINRNMGVALLTTGPGATNAITGVVGAWQDSTPMLVLSGQCKRKQTVYNSGLKELRQFGPQEVNILPLIESVTKYSAMVNEPNEIRYHLEKALYMSKNGRPGPVWLDIPLDVQGAIINECDLIGFDSAKEQLIESKNNKKLEEESLALITSLQEADRPVIIAGNGINIANAVEEFNQLTDLLGVPVVTPRLGIDLMDSDNRLFIGRPGIKGDRAANFTVQNADLIIAIGTRLSVNVVGHEYEKFARDAKVIVIDIDEVEHKKHTITINQFIEEDALVFINELIRNVSKVNLKMHTEWVDRCNTWKGKYPVLLPEYEQQGSPVNTYYFTDQLSKELVSDDVVVIDSGSSSYVVSQSIKVKKGQRFLASGGLGSMGYAVPAAIGASVALNSGRVICITGDGSFHMNIQELQTIIHNNLPIKMFVYNNDGYSSIKATQNNFFQGRYIGVDKFSGVSLPNLEKVAELYGIKSFRVDDTKNVNSIIKEVLEHDGPVICDVVCSPNQLIIPTVFSLKKEDGTMVSKPLEDMYPFLERDEFNSEMIVDPLME